MPLSEVDRVMQHVQLGKGSLRGLCAPVLMDITHHAAPCLDLIAAPVTRAQQAMLQLLQPAREDGVRGSGGSRDVLLLCGCSEKSRAAFSPDPLADLWPVEVVQVSSATAARRVHGGDALQRCLYALLAQQLA